MDISVRITNEMEILNIVKYWLPNIKIISPKYIDELLRNDLKKYLESEV